MKDKRVIVVGTTGDYIGLIQKRFPQKALFITDPVERAKWLESAPDESSELLFDLSDLEGVGPALEEHLRRFDQRPSGITCYDCESMLLASRLARWLGLPFVSEEAVIMTRNKFLSKMLWMENDVSCPKAELISSLNDAVQFFDAQQRSIILKPLTGSGSELVFLCETREECLRAYRALKSGLADHPNRRMYRVQTSAAGTLDPHDIFVAEEYVHGREYSCDFILEGGRVEIIRTARKVPALDQAPGTTQGYLVPAILPGGLSVESLSRQLLKASQSVGLERAMAMVDFIVHHDRAYILELTPRPGGDCLPELILRCSGFDIIGAALAFATGVSPAVPPPQNWSQLVGVRLLSRSAGVIKHIDTSRLANDSRIVSVEIRRRAGHEVILPPEDYESRLLGNVIFRPNRPHAIESECREIADLLIVEMEIPSWAAPKIS